MARCTGEYRIAIAGWLIVDAEPRATRSSRKQDWLANRCSRLVRALSLIVNPSTPAVVQGSRILIYWCGNVLKVGESVLFCGLWCCIRDQGLYMLGASANDIEFQMQRL